MQKRSLVRAIIVKSVNYGRREGCLATITVGRSRKCTHTRSLRCGKPRCRFFCIAPRRSRFRARPKKVIVVERVSSGREMRSIKLDLHVLSLVPRNNTPTR